MSEDVPHAPTGVVSSAAYPQWRVAITLSHAPCSAWHDAPAPRWAWAERGGGWTAPNCRRGCGGARRDSWSGCCVSSVCSKPRKISRVSACNWEPATAVLAWRAAAALAAAVCSVADDECVRDFFGHDDTFASTPTGCSIIGSGLGRPPLLWVSAAERLSVLSSLACRGREKGARTGGRGESDLRPGETDRAAVCTPPAGSNVESPPSAPLPWLPSVSASRPRWRGGSERCRLASALLASAGGERCRSTGASCCRCCSCCLATSSWPCLATSSKLDHVALALATRARRS